MKLWPFSMERRIEPRRKPCLKAAFQVRDDFSGNLLTAEHPTLIMDISHHGCCLALERLDWDGFHLHRCLEEPRDFPLELRLRPTGSQELTVRGEVKWINREHDQGGRPFRVGLALAKQEAVTPLVWWRLNRKG